MSKIRIRGLVRLMNNIRTQLSNGIPASEVATFRRSVRNGIVQVDTICRKHGVTPDDLPTPSRRAYHYLKSLDLDHVPVRKTDAPAPPTRIRVKNLIASCNRYQAKFTRLISQGDIPESDIEELAARLRAQADVVEALCEEQGASPGDLPIRSRRAYQWLRFLGEVENLSLHFAALATVLHIARAKACRKALPAAQRELPVRIEFYVTSALYRGRMCTDEIRVVLNEGFIDAPKPVLKSLLCCAFNSQDPAHQRTIKEYAATDAFQEITLALELSTAKLIYDSRGQHYNLDDVFKRVNVQYFDGALSKPHLTWSKQFTPRTMGHYQPATDTLMLSLTLDNKRVPAYVVEFIMYHELLHKKLGVEMVNGRHYAHTPEFRDAERSFPHYDDVQVFLAKFLSE